MNILTEIRKFIAFDFKFHASCIPVFVILLLLWPAAVYLPERCGYENELIENFQMFILFFCCYLWTLQKKYRKLFVFAALIFFFMMCREVNFGRALFFPDPVIPNKFLRWNKIWYAPYVGPGIAIYGMICVIFFFVGKVYKQVFELLTTTRIPVWHIVSILICWAGAAVLDKVCDNLILEEGVELGAYVAIFATACHYAFMPSER